MNSLFWIVQKKYKLSTKTVSMTASAIDRFLNRTIDALLQRLLDHSVYLLEGHSIPSDLDIQILTIWGLIGVHTDKFGFKHVWEIW